MERAEEAANMTSQASCRAVVASRSVITSQASRGSVTARPTGSQARRRGKVNGTAGVAIVWPQLQCVVGPYFVSGNSTSAYQTAAKPPRATHQTRPGDRKSVV